MYSKMAAKCRRGKEGRREEAARAVGKNGGEGEKQRSGDGEDGGAREEAFVTGLDLQAGKAAAEQTQFRSQSQGVSENKLVSSENQVKETATIEELPQRILSGIRENRAEFEIPIEPGSVGQAHN